MGEPLTDCKNGKYLTPLNVWALSIGCAVGWGAFVMPGTTFLPLAGPVGTSFGIAIGAFLMLIIGLNYHYLMIKYPDDGGTFTYAARTFGFDHGILSAWFLILVYIAIMWANATAVVLIARNVLGKVFQFGFHYKVEGYDVFGAEVALTLFVIIFFGIICMLNKRLAIMIQTVMALLLVAGVLICAVSVLLVHGGVSELPPSFADSGRNRIHQVLSIVVLAPWAFAGFESISNSTHEFNFSLKKIIWVMMPSLVVAALCYISLNLVAASRIAPGFTDRTDYINNLDRLEGFETIPVFNAVYDRMGQGGIIILSLAVLSGIITGLIGNYIAAGRLIFSMAEKGFLPEWFHFTDDKNNPVNVYKFLIIISLAVPFAGRVAIGWIIDINTIGALIAYAYTSASALREACIEKNRLIKATGIIGLSVAVIFFLYFLIPNIWSAAALSAESYLILTIWSVLGFVFFRYVLIHDRENRVGKSTMTWIVLLFMILFVTMLWLRQTTLDSTKRILHDLNDFNSMELRENGITPDREDIEETSAFLQSKMDEVNTDMVRSSWAQMAVIAFVLVIMISVYNSIIRREKEMEYQKIKAEESNRAKSIFLSNMSHDIRTPMNAIIGYTAIAKKDDAVSDKTRDYLEKIESSGKHLLALINDILDMSRIENGKMELLPENTDMFKLFDDVRDMFSNQMQNKGLDYGVDYSGVKNRYLMCDANRLNRVLLNLISNAYKFTPKGGSVSVVISERGQENDRADLQMVVADTGMGMSPEFLTTIFEAYTREKTVSKIQGTGLGMSITKKIVDMMEGEIKVESEPGKGSRFIINLSFPIAEAPGEANKETKTDPAEIDLSGIKILLADDNEINREIAKLNLEFEGFELETVENGQDAYERIASSAPGDFDVVLMDVQMPVMNGYEATRAIRSLKDRNIAGIPILAVTANAFAEDIEAAQAAGMDGHLTKPIDVDKIKEELARVLNKKNGV